MGVTAGPGGEQIVDQTRIRRCPFCDAPIRDGERFDAPAPLRDDLARSLAPIRRLRLRWMIALTVGLLATALGGLLHHRDVGSIGAAVMCVLLAGTLWYGRLTRRGKHTEH
jgi:hypothetical protein